MNLIQPLRIVLLLLLLNLSVVLSGISQFIEVTGTNNIVMNSNNPLFGNAACFVDFDEDGWDDITLAGKNQAPKFYHNNAGSFQQIFPVFNPALPTNVDYKALLWVDYDNDGDKDMIFSAILTAGPGLYPLKVYRNDGNLNFLDVSLSIGILPETPEIFGVSAGDMENDGDLDLFVCKYHNDGLYSGYQYGNRLYKNNGDGTFSDATDASGIGTHIQASFMSVWIDYDADGDQDIYVVNDRYPYPNYLYQNNGNGTFVDVTATSGAGIYIEAMSATVGDYDQDCDMDVYVSNTYPSEEHPFGNALLNNQGDGTFTEVGVDAGIQANDYICWGGLWLDYDNDTWLDLFVGTIGTIGTLEGQNYFFINQQDGTFEEGMAQVGLANDIDATHASAMGDMNQDGYYDFVTNNSSPTYSSLWLNDGGNNNYVSVSVQGTISNRDGIGTLIEAFACGKKYLNYTFCGENYLGQNSEREIFGLSDCEAVDSLKLHWLSGLNETYYNVEINSHHHYIEGASYALPLAIQTSGDPALCSGDSLEITLAVSEGSILWNTGDTTNTLTIALPGQYFAEVTSVLGFVQATDTVTVSILPLPEASSEVVPVSCAGLSNGEITVTSESSIATCDWNDGADGVHREDLPPGNYSFVVTDINGCSVEGSAEVTTPDSLTVVYTTTDALCFGSSDGQVEITAEGGTPPYIIDYAGADPQALSSNNYSVLIDDFNGCSVTIEFYIDQPEPLTGTVDTAAEINGISLGSATADITGGTPPYLYTWSTGISSDDPTLPDLAHGEYALEVTDAQGCTWQHLFTIDLIDLVNEIDPTTVATYPNPCTKQITLESRSYSIRSLHIADENGQAVFRKTFASATTLVEIQVSGWSPGIYLAEVHFTSGTWTVVKFTVE